MLKKYIFAALLALFFVINAVPVAAQRPRTADDDPNRVVTPPPPAPPTVKASMKAGVWLHKKKTGTLTIDALIIPGVQRSKGKEMFHIPWSITGVRDSHYKQPAAATVVSHLPYTDTASFIKTKVRYLTSNTMIPIVRPRGHELSFG